MIYIYEMNIRQVITLVSQISDSTADMMLGYHSELPWPRSQSLINGYACEQVAGY